MISPVCGLQRHVSEFLPTPVSEQAEMAQIFKKKPFI